MSTAEAVAAINAARASVVKVTDQNVVLAGECAALPKTPVDDVYPLSKVMSEHVDTSTWAALAAIAQLDVALAALTGDVLPPVPSPTPPPEPSPTPPPTPHPDLILERSNVTKTEVLKIGELAGTRTVTGVFEAPPADGKWRKLIGPDSTKGRYGGFCVGLTNEGKLEAWVDDGTTMRQALLGVTPGKGSFFSMRLSSTAMVPAVDDATVAVQLPNGIVEFDGPAYIGAGVYNHKVCDPIDNPPGAKLLKIRVYRVELTQAQIDADEKEWADLIDTVPDVPVDPGGGGGTPGGGGSLEPVDGSATQVLGVAAPGARQTILGWGAGLGPINELGQVFPLIQKYAQTDFDAIRINTMRLIWSGDGGGLGRAYKPVLDWIKARMIHYDEELWVHATGYGFKVGDPINSANRLAASIKAGVDTGCQIDSVCIQNEPGGTDPHWEDSDHVPAHRQMRAELDRYGLQRIKLVGLEYAKDDGWIAPGNVPKNVRRSFDNLNGAGLIPGAVAFGAVHCYGDCTSAELYDKRWLTKGCSIFQLESGFGSTPSIGGRIVNDLNTGISRWSYHLLQARGADSPGDYGQKLVDSNGNGCNYYRSFQACSTRFAPGVVMRLCTVNGGRAVFTQGNKSPMFLAAGRAPDGKWVLAAQNFIGNRQQVTFRVDEMAGRGGTLNGTRVNGSGNGATNVRYEMNDGKTRFTLGGNEMIVLVGP